MSATKLTDKQRVALEVIRDNECYGRPHEPHPLNGIYGPLVRTNRTTVNFDWGMVGRLEKRGLITRHADNPAETTFLLKITDAGRVALGDWAAAGRGTGSS